MTSRQQNQNIKTLNFYTFLSFFGISSLWMLYLASRGMNLAEIGYLEAIFHFSSLCFELVSGIIADHIGYKISLMLGRGAALISALIMLISHDFTWLMVGFIFSALSYNFNSGTVEALLFETLNTKQPVKSYLDANISMNVVIEFAQPIGLILAGLLSQIWFASVYIIASLLAASALVTCFFMREPQSRTQNHDPFAMIRQCFHELNVNKPLRRLILSFSSMEVINATFFFYFQTYLSDHGITGLAISGLLLISMVLQMLGVKLSGWADRHFSKTVLLRGMALVLAACIFLSCVVSLPGIFVLYLAANMLSSFSYPLASAYTNPLIPSPIRATMLSVSSMCFSLGMIFIFPLIGTIANGNNLQQAFIVLAGLAVAAAGLIWVLSQSTFIKQSR